MRRGREIARLLDRIDEEVRLTREFLREDRLRFEKLMQRIDRTMERGDRAWERTWGKLDHVELKLDAHWEEYRAEAAAQREALFRMMDRLGPGPGQAPSGA